MAKACPIFSVIGDHDGPVEGPLLTKTRGKKGLIVEQKTTPLSKIYVNEEVGRRFPSGG